MVALVAQPVVLVALGAIPYAVAEVDGEAEGHPHGEANPGLVVEQSHQVEVDEHADQWQRRHKRHLQESKTTLFLHTAFQN